MVGEPMHYLLEGAGKYLAQDYGFVAFKKRKKADETSGQALTDEDSIPTSRKRKAAMSTSPVLEKTSSSTLRQSSKSFPSSTSLPMHQTSIACPADFWILVMAS
jgi:hypothetical protein